MFRNNFSVFVVVVGAILFAFMAYLAWLNRESPRVQEILAPAIAFGLVVPFIAIFVVLKDERKEKVVSVGFLYETSTKREIYLDGLYKTAIGGAVNEDSLLLPPDLYTSVQHEGIQSVLRSKFGTLGGPKEYDRDEGDVDANDMSHDLMLYYKILIVIFMRDLYDTFGHGWDAKVEEYVAPVGTRTTTFAESPGGEIVWSWEEIRERVIEAGTVQREEIPERVMSISGGLHLPPNTNVEFESEKEIEITLHLKNRFAEIWVTLMPLGQARSLGQVGKLLDYPETGDSFRSSSYKISAVAEFNRFRMGHPDMDKYRSWVENIFSVVDSYSFETKLKELREWRAYR